MANWWDMPAGWEEGDPPPILNSPLGPVEAGPKAGGVYVKLNGRSGGVPHFGGLSYAENQPGYKKPAAEVAPQQADQPAQPTPIQTYGMQGKQPQGASQPQQYGGMKGKQSQGASRPQQYNGGTPMGQNTQQMQGKQSKQQPGQYNQSGGMPPGENRMAYKGGSKDFDESTGRYTDGRAQPGTLQPTGTESGRIYTGPGSDPNADQNDVFGPPEGFVSGGEQKLQQWSAPDDAGTTTALQVEPNSNPPAGTPAPTPEVQKGWADQLRRGAPDANRGERAPLTMPEQAQGPGNAPPLGGRQPGNMQGKQAQVQQYLPQVQQMMQGKQPQNRPGNYNPAGSQPVPQSQKGPVEQKYTDSRSATGSGSANTYLSNGLRDRNPTDSGRAADGSLLGNQSENALAAKKKAYATDRKGREATRNPDGSYTVISTGGKPMNFTAEQWAQYKQTGET